MAYLYKSATAIASTYGEMIYTVPNNKVITLIGCRLANVDYDIPHTFHVMVDSTLISGKNTPLPAGSAIDIMVGSKLIVEGASTIQVVADANNAVAAYISFLEQ